jgi:uncharacterized membrane protein
VVVLVLRDAATAIRAGNDIGEAVGQGRFDVSDWLVVENAGGKLKLHRRMEESPATGFAGGAILGALAGLAFGAVVVPALIAGTAAGVAAARNDHGFPRSAIEAIGGALHRGEAALLVLADANSAGMIHQETFQASTLQVFELDVRDPDAVASLAAELGQAYGAT